MCQRETLERLSLELALVENADKASFSQHLSQTQMNLFKSSLTSGTPETYSRLCILDVHNLTAS